jgi:hypothetical protein
MTFLGHQNSKYPAARAEEGAPSVPVAGSNPNTPLRFSQAAWLSAGSEPTRSRIISQAAMLSAPSGGGPIARETAHCGQKEMRCAADFWRGLIPTVCANIYRATDLCPASSSRLQRRQRMFSKRFSWPDYGMTKVHTVFGPGEMQVCRKIRPLFLHLRGGNCRSRTKM